MTRHRAPTRAAHTEALFAAPAIYDIATAIDDLPLRRRRRYPTALLLAYGALARLHRAQNRLDTELAGPGAWHQLLDSFNAAAATRDVEPVALHLPRITTDTYRHFRDWLCAQPERLDTLTAAFTETAVTTARTVGLLDPNGPGSLTRPHPSRVIYGDGTIVRPIYTNSPTGTRVDPDAAKHVRHDGTIVGNNLVHVATRGPEPHRRVILAVGRVPRPGQEAATAVGLIRRVHRHAGAGIQAVVYDGAFRGIHHDTLMTDLGVMVVNRVHPAGRDGDDRTWRPVLLGTWTHTPRRRPCAHALVAHNGAICDSQLNDSGQLVLSNPLPRRQVRRNPRHRKGGWRFSLGVDIACPHGAFTAWISPHGVDGTAGRPDQIRLLPEHDGLFLPIYGLRNDSEAINAAYKRTLLSDRASALGWRRQLLDMTSWALLGNTLAWQLHRSDTSRRAA